jgi:hypothetical protein
MASIQAQRLECARGEGGQIDGRAEEGDQVVGTSGEAGG